MTDNPQLSINAAPFYASMKCLIRVQWDEERITLSHAERDALTETRSILRTLGATIHRTPDAPETSIVKTALESAYRNEFFPTEALPLMLRELADFLMTIEVDPPKWDPPTMTRRIMAIRALYVSLR